MRILVAEDNIDINQSIVSILQGNGYSVDTGFSGEETLEYIESAEYDAIVLDIMIPGKDGFQILQEIRQNKNSTPVLFLTAKGEIADRVKGLDLGADDYLVKPFSGEELLARIRVAIRRKAGNSDNLLIMGDLTIDIGQHKVLRGGINIELSSKEFNILEYLVQNSGIVLSRDQILEHAWNFDYLGGSNIVDVYINYLRKKIDAPYKNKLIHTIRGRGYILREES